MELVEQIFLVLAYVAVIGFLVNGLDDLFFDIGFLHFLVRTRKSPHLTLQDLKLVPEQWIALFVPAWQEGGVVNKMAEYASRICIYERYDIFIGVYPNDPETNQCVDKLCAVNSRIHKVVVPHPGPTSKADCLNWIYKAMRLNEIPGAREYQVIALHDAEDVLHPLVLKVYNYFVPREYDMGQVPVFALELPVLSNWTGNSYVDDFAELHTKDLFVRQNMGGIVPSAGVGTCFSRSAVDKLAAGNQDDPFFVGNLTEDYEVGIRVKRAGMRAGVLSVPVERVVRRKRRDGTLGEPRTITEVIAIRETFPAKLRAAIRQRSRWILGISFQTWEQSGWAGTLPMRYTLLRDRRAPLTHLINMIGYAILLFILFQWLFRNTSWAETHYMRPLFNSQSLLWKLTIIDTGLLIYRAAQKMISVYSIYNVKQAIFSVPRVVVGNLINFIATARALRMYLAHKLFGEPIVWLKTAHIFPAEAQLAEYTKTIEDLLVEEGLVTHEQIVQALRMEKGASAPLSLLRMGLLDENQFTAIWARHSGLPVRLVDPSQISTSLLQRFSEGLSLVHEAIPAADVEQRVLMVFREPPTSSQLAEISREIRMAVQPFLARPSNIAFARTRAYPRLVLPPSRLAEVTERFRQAAKMDQAAFLEAISDEARTGQSLPDVLVDKALIDAGDARKLWAECLDCSPFEMAEWKVEPDVFDQAGRCFWWLHRMLPARGGLVVTAFAPHPEVQQWLSSRTGTRVTFAAELPRRVELAARNQNLEIDPDQMLIDCLVRKGLLRKDQLPNLAAMRQLTTDSASRWLLLQQLVTEDQLHQCFLEICDLPVAPEWQFAEVNRLMPVFPPGFVSENACYPLQESKGAIRLGLGKMPSPAALRLIYNRLAGYALSFQVLSFDAAAHLRKAVA